MRGESRSKKRAHFSSVEISREIRVRGTACVPGSNLRRWKAVSNLGKTRAVIFSLLFSVPPAYVERISVLFDKVSSNGESFYCAEILLNSAYTLGTFFREQSVCAGRDFGSEFLAVFS